MAATDSMQHVTVYRNDSEYCGWPFNGGFWQFADGELACGFIVNRFDYAVDKVHHERIDAHGGRHVIIRSYDGGLTWDTSSMTCAYSRPELDAALFTSPSKSLVDDATAYDSAADDYCLLAGFGIPPKQAPHLNFIMLSQDRGHRWSAPITLPKYRGFMGGRPSYIRRPDGMLLLFFHGREAEGTTAQPLVFGSRDHGRNWALIAEVAMTPSEPCGIMGFPLLLKDGRILLAVRRQYAAGECYTQVYQSEDQGRTWALLSRANDWGAPASLTELADGRIVCIYGYRQRPGFGIRATISADGGRTWGAEHILRDDGGSQDLGYPRTHLRPDGALVTVYYMNTRHDPIQSWGGVRHIAATIWRPPAP